MVLNILTAFVPCLALLVGAMPLVGLVYWRRARHRSSGEQSPLSREMLRPPGYSLRERIRQLDYEIDAHVIAILIFPLAGYSIYLSQSHFANVPDTQLRALTVIVVGAIFIIHSLGALIRQLKMRSNFELGMEGELTTGQELDQLMLDGCRVYHDVPILYGNIDHVVVCRSGVYSINTKAIRKRGRAADSKVIVNHNENLLQFPDRTVPIPTDQLQTEAKWLKQHLRSATGEHVNVEPMLALPGWYISERIGRGPAYVFNPLRPQKFFVNNKRVLSLEQTLRIAHQLEQLCRNISPSQKDNKSWKQNE